MQISTLPSLDNLSKDELQELLKGERSKNEILSSLIIHTSFEFRTPLSLIIGWANVFLEMPGTIFPELTERQAECIEAMKNSASRVLDDVQLFIVAMTSLQLLEESLTKTKVSLLEMKYFESIIDTQIVTDLAQVPPIQADERTISTILELLRYLKKGEAMMTIGAKGDWVEFKASKLTNRPYWLEEYVDEKSKRLVCDEPQRFHELIYLFVALVESYGGGAYAELGSDSEYTLSFTLPVYREAT